MLHNSPSWQTAQLYKITLCEVLINLFPLVDFLKILSYFLLGAKPSLSTSFGLVTHSTLGLASAFGFSHLEHSSYHPLWLCKCVPQINDMQANILAPPPPHHAPRIGPKSLDPISHNGDHFYRFTWVYFLITFFWWMTHS